MSDAIQWVIVAAIYILVPVGVWFAGKAFAVGFKEGWHESKAKRDAEAAERHAARQRHPSSGVKPWALDDARDLTD